MFEYPKRLDYQYIIETDIGYCILRYKQSTSKETFEYFSLVDKKDIIRISDYWMKMLTKVEYVVTKKYFKFYYKWKLKNYLKKHIFDYHNEIMDSLHKVWTSKYDDEEEPKQKGERKQLFQNTEQIIYEMTGIPINEIHNILTIEQIGRWLDKARFDYYETFDAGKAINTNVRSKMGLSQEQKDLLDYIKNTKK